MRYKMIPPGWKSMDSAPKDGSPILGWCLHAADPYWRPAPPPDPLALLSDPLKEMPEAIVLTTYAAHCEGLSHVEDGPCVLVFGGGWDEGEDGWLPDWWFRDDGSFEVAANPIFYKEIEEVDDELLKLWKCETPAQEDAP